MEAGMRKRDWLMAAALVPYFIVMLPIATVGAVGLLAWGLWKPRADRARCSQMGSMQFRMADSDPDSHRCLRGFGHPRGFSS